MIRRGASNPRHLSDLLCQIANLSRWWRLQADSRMWSSGQGRSIHKPEVQAEGNLICSYIDRPSACPPGLCKSDFTAIARAMQSQTTLAGQESPVALGANTIGGQSPLLQRKLVVSWSEAAVVRRVYSHFNRTPAREVDLTSQLATHLGLLVKASARDRATSVTRVAIGMIPM